MTAPCSEGYMFRRFYVQNIFVQKVLLYSEGSMFRRFYIQSHSESPIFRIVFILCRKKLTSFSFSKATMQDSKSQITLAHSVR